MKKRGLKENNLVYIAITVFMFSLLIIVTYNQTEIQTSSEGLNSLSPLRGFLNTLGINKVYSSATGVNNAYHTECQNEKCITVTGSGDSKCRLNYDDCLLTKHSECITENNNKKCKVLNGIGINDCKYNSDCYKTNHLECDYLNKRCVSVSGPGINLCSTNTECNPKTHNECKLVNGKFTCQIVLGIGESQCNKPNTPCTCVPKCNVELPGDIDPVCGTYCKKENECCPTCSCYTTIPSVDITVSSIGTLTKIFTVKEPDSTNKILSVVILDSTPGLNPKVQKIGTKYSVSIFPLKNSYGDGYFQLEIKTQKSIRRLITYVIIVKPTSTSSGLANFGETIINTFLQPINSIKGLFITKSDESTLQNGDTSPPNQDSRDPYIEKEIEKLEQIIIDFRRRFIDGDVPACDEDILEPGASCFSNLPDINFYCGTEEDPLNYPKLSIGKNLAELEPGLNNLLQDPNVNKLFRRKMCSVLARYGAEQLGIVDEINWDYDKFKIGTPDHEYRDKTLYIKYGIFKPRKDIFETLKRETEIALYDMEYGLKLPSIYNDPDATFMFQKFIPERASLSTCDPELLKLQFYQSIKTGHFKPFFNNLKNLAKVEAIEYIDREACDALFMGKRNLERFCTPLKDFLKEKYLYENPNLKKCIFGITIDFKF